tara:strand:+ start:361 stop:702 length:342 start_codon:yes stop_codon:yes gene_type:complete
MNPFIQTQTFLPRAIGILTPDAEYSTAINEDGSYTIDWLDEKQTEPSKTAIDNKMAALKTEFDATEYQRDREYPVIGDQLDMLWHAIDDDALDKTSDFYTLLKAVKDAHPKPS